MAGWRACWQGVVYLVCGRVSWWIAVERACLAQRGQGQDGRVDSGATWRPWIGVCDQFCAALLLVLPCTSHSILLQERYIERRLGGLTCYDQAFFSSLLFSCCLTLLLFGPLSCRPLATMYVSNAKPYRHPASDHTPSQKKTCPKTSFPDDWDILWYYVLRACKRCACCVVMRKAMWAGRRTRPTLLPSADRSASAHVSQSRARTRVCSVSLSPLYRLHSRRMTPTCLLACARV